MTVVTVKFTTCPGKPHAGAVPPGAPAAPSPVLPEPPALLAPCSQEGLSVNPGFLLGRTDHRGHSTKLAGWAVF